MMAPQVSAPLLEYIIIGIWGVIKLCWSAWEHGNEQAFRHISIQWLHSGSGKGILMGVRPDGQTGP